MMRARLSAVLAALMVLAFSSASVAQTKRDKALARKHYKAGKKAYATEEYRKAAKEFAAGYLHDPKPAFLINIAQSYRKAGDLKQAAHYYREFLKEAPDSKLAPQVEGLVKEIEGQIKAREPEPEPEPETSEAITQPPPPPPERESPFYKQWWFWTAVGAVVVAGVGAGIYAGTREPDYVKEGGLGSISW
jgi:tetratricopeptide (TPR) repeat protein